MAPLRRPRTRRMAPNIAAILRPAVVTSPPLRVRDQTLSSSRRDLMPVAVARLPKLSDRTSGLLLHPTSLPGGPEGGQLGGEARAFGDFLAAAGQRWWQTLP